MYLRPEVVNCFQFFKFMENSQAGANAFEGDWSCELLSVL